MAGKDYDVAAAFQAIEYELINSFFRNMKKHKVDEVKEQKQWEMWQVKQLQELDLYKKRNTKKYGTKFTDINKTIAEMIRLSNEEGQMDQEAEILSAMEKGLKPQRAPEQMTAQFFRTNDRKLDTLINATVSDMERAEVAVLRKADDVYRKTIFNAIVYANTGAGTYEKAIDMATKDFMKAGLTCVEYKNGSKHTISDYADMAVRTANKRAYLQGEGAKRQEWGIHTVIVNKRLRACPHCMPFAGKVFIDDVWGGGTAADGDYPLLSEAVAAGLYHPRCKDSHTAYFPGITGKPKKYTKAEVKEAEKVEEQERKADYAERQAESYQRLADTRLDPENKRQEQAKADRRKGDLDRIKSTNKQESGRRMSSKTSETSSSDLDFHTMWKQLRKEPEDIGKMSVKARTIAAIKDPTKQMMAIDVHLNKYFSNSSQWSRTVLINDNLGVFGKHDVKNHDITLRSDATLKTKIHELIHTRTIYMNGLPSQDIVYKYHLLNEAITELTARKICEAEGIEVINPTYPKLVSKLKKISKIMKIDELKLGVTLVDIPFENRYAWIEAMIGAMKNNNEISDSDYKKALKCLNGLVRG